MESLRGAAERLILNPYKTKRKDGLINVIAAPTGVGKTYSIMYHLIPHDIELGYRKFIVLTVYRDNVYQDAKNYEEALFGKAIVTEKIDHFLSYKGKMPMVLISTIANSTMGGPKSDVEFQNDQMLLNLIRNNSDKIAIYWDEAHFGGSSNQQTFPVNTGYGIKKYDGYNGTYYSFIESACVEGCKVTGFTATPIFEQQELLEHISNGYYKILTNAKDWPTLEERTEIGSQYRNISFYDTDIDFAYSLKQGLIDFYSFSESFANRADIINSFDPNINALRKPVMLIATGREGTKSGYEMSNGLDTIIEFYKDKIDENDFFVGTATQDGYFIYNTRGDRKKLKQDQFFDSIEDDTNSLQIIVFIEKFKFGLNINNITHEIHMRERNSSTDNGFGRVTIPIIQTYGRAVRTWFGIKNDDLNSVFVSDAVKYLNKFIGTKIYGVLREHMMYSNSHTLYVPDNAIFRQSIDEWKERYAVSLNFSQFNTAVSKPSVGLPFHDIDCDDDVCPTCKRPFHVEVDDKKFSIALGIAA